MDLLSDLSDSLTPLRTGDYGMFEFRWCNEEEFESELVPWKAGAAERNDAAELKDAELARMMKPGSTPEMLQSAELIEQIQAAITCREAALRNPQTSDTMQGMLKDTFTKPGKKVLGPGHTQILGRLALEPFADQELAKENMEDVDLANARIDMTDLLPPDILGDPLSQRHISRLHGTRQASASAELVVPDDEDLSSYSYYSDYEQDEPAATPRQQQQPNMQPMTQRA
uniref:Uncharacterized protein n=1 Tax=Haptolina brevifila TaxID=156173 RepID=A0A7S2BSV4_9EUKA|mmetsp:Transcript_16252/g.32678  ORF Transcript_16252/g.32678 Transcript_16252/m.32678 type:complete len:228 (+) Transcript_16252:95-778(+)